MHAKVPKRNTILPLESVAFQYDESNDETFIARNLHLFYEIARAFYELHDSKWDHAAVISQMSCFVHGNLQFLCMPNLQGWTSLSSF